MKLLAQIITLSFLFFASQACGSDDTSPRADQETQEQGLTDFEMEHGIGPVTEQINIDEEEFDPELITKGRDIYEMKCEMCHNMEGRMVGPELGDVMERRSPEFVMNFILNPSGMVREHPEGQRLLQEYMTAMPYQNVKEDEARAIVEFLRDYNKNN